MFFKGSSAGDKFWNLSFRVFAETAALFAIYLMPCLFFLACIKWKNNESVTMRVTFQVFKDSTLLEGLASARVLWCALQDASLGPTAERRLALALAAPLTA